MAPIASRGERIAAARAIRSRLPRSAHMAIGYEGAAATSRPDPIAILVDQGKDRLPELLPYRYGRMAASPFAFLRGAAAVQAGDLGSVPDSGIHTQLLGDCHLENFGFYATPERALVFDVNDFDETLPGPFEWDLKRLAASFVLSARENGFDDDEAVAAALEVGRAYGNLMRDLSQRSTLEVWYDRIDGDSLLSTLPPDSEAQRVLAKTLKRSRKRETLRAVGKLTIVEDGERRFREDPPLLVRVQDPGLRDRVVHLFGQMCASLEDDRRFLLERYRPVDVAHKVVGVGSVGTRCFVALFEGPGGAETQDGMDPLLLQIKEASTSVLAPAAGPSRYLNEGERVVQGQRLMQSASDLFLGWLRGPRERDYYFRQLHDMKGSVDPGALDAETFVRYARLCGVTLARAHARSGDPAAITGYVGTGDAFPKAIADYGVAYADRTREDHALLLASIEDGRVPATTEPGRS